VLAVLARLVVLAGLVRVVVLRLCPARVTG
jgi:hypothetical protein